ncbi:MAG: hypothetical protein R2755_22590 [Acidimicrobiales bacterium]
MLFDTEKLRQGATFARRAVRRHPVTALGGVVLVLGAGSVSWLAAPLTYQSTAVLSARSDVVSSAIANPGRAVPQGADQPLANARETIMSEANIDRIIDDAGLIQRAQDHAGETSLGELRRLVFDAVGLGQSTDVDKLREDLRRELRESLLVQIDGGSNGPDRLTITVYWTDADDATAIVAAAQENFLEDRHQADLGPIEAALAILERYKADADADVEQLREELGFPQTETRDLPDGSPLRSALQTQSDLEDRLNDARIEVDAAEAAFEYRYSVVQTPEVPLGPVSSMAKRVVMTLGLAVIAAVGLAAAKASFRKRGRDGTAEPAAVAVVDDPPAGGAEQLDGHIGDEAPVVRRAASSDPATPLRVRVSRVATGAASSTAGSQPAATVNPAATAVVDGDDATLLNALLDGPGAAALHPPKLPVSPRKPQRLEGATPPAGGPWARTGTSTDRQQPPTR